MKSNKALIVFSLIFIFVALGFTYFIAEKAAQDKLQSNVENQLVQVVNELKITLERHSYLPALLSSDPNIIKLLNLAKLTQNQSKTDEFLKSQLEVNLSLELTNNISESSTIYVMRPNGSTIASSNWESTHSFIGKNFSYRPYFKQALQNILGRYYAVGAISGERGYFFASSILENNKVIGVVAIKVAIDDIEFTWGQGAIDFLVTDPNGVVFLSSQKDWNLKSLLPLSAEQQSKLLKSRRYGTKAITPINDTHISLEASNFQKITLMNKDYEMLTHKMELADWEVRVISSHVKIKESILKSMLISALILSLLTALGALLWKTQQQRKKYQQQITEELERKVIQRTKALKQSQEDLIQAAKMAALGQLSAGITHEINNPLTAIRAYADNARQFLEKNRLDMVESNLTEITSLTEKMATITRQLKSFSRKSKGQITPVLLGSAINNALSIVHPKIVSQSVICHWDDSEHGVNKSVLADEVWLGQILVNLLSNAISATQDNPKPQIWITINSVTSSGKKQLCIQIKDNGIGIEKTALPHIFEPFFTTKPSAKGLGLGLSISFNLAKDMNGYLDAHNRDENSNEDNRDGNQKSGAEFNLCLPIAQ